MKELRSNWNPAVLTAVTGAAGRSYDDIFDGIADGVQESFTPGVLDSFV